MNARYVRYLAGAAAAASALLYYLIGFGVLNIGESTSGEADLLSFGLTAGTTFLVVGGLVVLIRRRWLWAAVALLDAAVIVGYFAFAGIRVPPYELWGLTVKAAQLVLLVALAVLLSQGTAAGDRSRIEHSMSAGGL